MSDLKQIFAMVLVLMQKAETAFPAGTKGADKAAAVLAALQAWAPLVNVSLDALATLEPFVKTYMDAMVVWFKAQGIFHSSTPAPAPAAS